MNKTSSILLIIAILGLGAWFFSGERTADDELADTGQATEKTVLTAEVPYFGDATGFFAEPEEPGDYPGVVLIHEWWGLNDHIRESARKLASEGYSVLAVDLYEGKVATTSADAQKYRNSIDQARTIENLKAAVDHLREQGADKIASFGWCFGGGKSLELALSGEDLDATIIYYGQLVTDPQKLKQISWPVLGVFGDRDATISTTSVAAFDRALDSIGVDNEIYMYPGVGHAFANPSNQNHAPAETADAWAKTLTFLNRTLKE